MKTKRLIMRTISVLMAVVMVFAMMPMLANTEYVYGTSGG